MNRRVVLLVTGAAVVAVLMVVVVLVVLVTRCGSAQTWDIRLGCQPNPSSNVIGWGRLG